MLPFMIFLTAQNFKLFRKKKNFLNDAFDSYYDLFQDS